MLKSSPVSSVMEESALITSKMFTLFGPRFASWEIDEALEAMFWMKEVRQVLRVE